VVYDTTNFASNRFDDKKAKNNRIKKLIHCIVKYCGGKKVWQIPSLVKKLWK